MLSNKTTRSYHTLPCSTEEGSLVAWVKENVFLKIDRTYRQIYYRIRKNIGSKNLYHAYFAFRSETPGAPQYVSKILCAFFFKHDFSNFGTR